MDSNFSLVVTAVRDVVLAIVALVGIWLSGRNQQKLAEITWSASQTTTSTQSGSENPGSPGKPDKNAG